MSGSPLIEPISGLVDLPMNHMNMPSSNSNQTHRDSSQLPRSSYSDSDLDMAFQDLLLACRAGDHETVDSLTLIPNIDINQVDEWDYSPLILASLCGHLSIVELLLARGAVCDRDTFQGARCIYGALNDEIRTLLLSYDITKKVDENQPFSAHISRLLAPAFSPLSARDLAIVFPGETRGAVFVVNRFLLAAQSPYFHEKLVDGAWLNKTTMTMPERSDATAFKAIIDYLYLRTDLLPLEMPLEQFRQFAKKLKLGALLEVMDEMPNDRKGQARARQKAQFDFVDVAKNGMMRFVKEHIFRNSIEVFLQDDVDFEDIDASALLDADNHQKLLASSALSDVIVSSIDIESGLVVYYPAHRAILARSEYYATMFRSDVFCNSHGEVPLAEVRGSNGDRPVDRTNIQTSHVPVLQASLSTTKREVTEIILLFLYYDDVQHIPSHLGVELLFAAEELWIDRLKTMCALSLTALIEKLDFVSLLKLPKLTGYDVCELIEISWQTRCDRLEQHMTKLIAHNLEEICAHPLRQKLMDTIRHSAHRIRERQDTDTIELVDDIRYYLAKKFAVYDNFDNLDGIAFEPENLEDNRIYAAALRDHGREEALIDLLLEELALDA